MAATTAQPYAAGNNCQGPFEQSSIFRRNERQMYFNYLSAQEKVTAVEKFCSRCCRLSAAISPDLRLTCTDACFISLLSFLFFSSRSVSFCYLWIGMQHYAFLETSEDVSEDIPATADEVERQCAHATAFELNWHQMRGKWSDKTETMHHLHTFKQKKANSLKLDQTSRWPRQLRAARNS